MPDRVTFSITLPAETHAWLTAEAERAGVDINAVVQRLADQGGMTEAIITDWVEQAIGAAPRAAS